MEDNHNDHIQHITPLSRDEQETAINWFATDINVTWNTAIPREIKQLDGYVSKYPDIFKCTHEDELHRYKIYTFPRKYIKVTEPRTEAQTEASRRNIARANHNI